MPEDKGPKFEKVGGLLRSDRRLYETRDGRVVEEGDPEAHMLVVGAGGLISPRAAERLGITESGIKQPKKEAVVVPSSVAGDAPKEEAAPAAAPAREEGSAVGKHGSVTIAKGAGSEPARETKHGSVTMRKAK